MRLALAFLVAAAPALAQETTPVPAPEDDGFSLVEEGAKLVLRGLMTEMQPALDEMGKAMDGVGPALEGFGEEVGPKIRQLIAMIDDIQNYDAPVMLPNGDILIRRNAPLVPLPRLPYAPVPGPNGEIDL
jgi:hypothetical protein